MDLVFVKVDIPNHSKIASYSIFEGSIALLTYSHTIYIKKMDCDNLIIHSTLLFQPISICLYKSHIYILNQKGEIMLSTGS